MPQHDYQIDNQTFPATRADLNSVLAAIRSANSGATEPPDTHPFMVWADTAGQVMRQRNSSDSGWLVIGSLQDNKFLEKTGAYTVQIKDFDCFIAVNASTNLDITLPAASSVGRNFRVTVKRVDAFAHTVNIAASGADVIDGDPARALDTQYAACELVSDGSNAWHVAATAGAGGTVTSIASGTGLTGGPITVTGTLAADFATQAEAEAGLATDKVMSPARTAEAIAALTGGGAAAWANFKGMGTVLLRDSLNVSALTDHGQGDYALAFIAPMASSDYAAAFCTASDGGVYGMDAAIRVNGSTGAGYGTNNSPTSLRIATGTSRQTAAGDLYIDNHVVCAIVQGVLA